MNYDYKDLQLKALHGARKLLVEKGWTKEYHARDLFDEGVPAICVTAASFCVEGAVLRAAFYTPGVPSNAWFLENILYKNLRINSPTPDRPIREFNDMCKTVEPVLDVIDKTIKKLEEHQ